MATLPLSTPDLLASAQAEFERALARNIKGLGYFTSPAPVLGASPKDVLVERGTMRLYRYRPRVDDVYRVPLLLVMATTNRGYIFDMVPGQSLVEYLLDHGFDVFMLDWAPPRADEKTLYCANQFNGPNGLVAFQRACSGALTPAVAQEYSVIAAAPDGFGPAFVQEI